MNDIVIELKNINFSYTEDVPILKNINIKIYHNEYVCIIGHNGSGKSTISKIITAILKPQEGDVYIFNEKMDKYNVKFLRKNVGIVFQNPDSQFIGITSEDDIAFGLENLEIAREDMQGIIECVAKKTNVTDLLKLESQKLSGGQKQKVAITSVLAIDPKIIIFDEATSMLDPQGKHEIKQTMLNLKKAQGKTIISITHDMEEVVNADRVIVLNKGIVVANGRPEEIFTNEKKLHDIALDFPFTLKLASLLKSKYNDVTLTLNLEQLLDNICKIIKL